MELYLHRIHINGVVLNYVEWHIYLLNPVYCINLSQKRVQCLLLKHNNESPTLILSTFCFTFLLTSSKPTFNAHILHNTLRYKLDFHESVHRDTITKVTNKMQIYRLIYYFKSALHVSGDVFAYHQEHLTVFTVSGSIHTGCCRLVSWMSWNSIQFSFGALIYVYSFSLFGVYKLDVHESVRRDTIIKVANKMQLYEYRLIYYF